MEKALKRLMEMMVTIHISKWQNIIHLFIAKLVEKYGKQFKCIQNTHTHTLG